MKTNEINLTERIDQLNQDKTLYLSVIDESGKIYFLNAALYKALQIAGDSPVGRNFHDFIHPKTRDSFKVSLKKQMGKSGSISTELQMPFQAGHWTKWEISRLEQEREKPSKFLCLGYNIAADKQLKNFGRITEKNYQAIVEELNIGLIFQDNKGGVIAANQKAATFLNTTMEELYTQKQLYAKLHIENEDGEPVAYRNAPFMKALETGQTQSNVEMNIRVQKDTWRTLLFNSQPLFEKNQAAPFAVATSILDISKEKQLVQEVKNREILFSSFMKYSPYFTWIIDGHAKLLFANESLLKYFHKSESVIGENVLELIPASISDSVYQSHQWVAKTGQPHHSIIKTKLADGKEHVFQLTVFPILGLSSTPLLGGKAIDITQSYHTRQQVKKVNERLLFINKASSEAMWDLNLKTGEIFSNEALNRLIGVNANNPSNLDWWLDRIHPEDRCKIQQRIRLVFDKKEKSWEDEYRFLCADDHYKMIHSRGFVIYELGEPHRMMVSFQDISEIKELEVRLSEQKLKQQKENAETIINSQQEERTRIGHELHDNVNQILATAQLYLSMIHPKGKDQNDIKVKTSDAIIMAIEEIRKLSKEMVMPNLTREGLVAGITNLVKDLEFIGLFHISFVHSDKCRIESLNQHKKITLFRIIQEQTKNITKYSAAKNVEISLNCCQQFIQLKISDDGVGFDTTKTRQGIGLSNIYERTRLYQGEVSLQSSPGKGCVLHVKIPVDFPIDAS